MIDMKMLTFREKIYSDAGGRSIVLTAKLKVPSEDPTSPPTVKEVVVKAKAYDDYEESAKVLEELTMGSRKHPNICDVYGYALHRFPSDSSNKILIVMEKLKCDLEKDAREREATLKYYTENELLEILWQLVDALCFMQEKGLCHRDIKPQNLFLSMDGSFKIGDFGSCKMSIVTASRELQGTPLYLSPALKNAFKSMMLTNQKEEVKDNMFKSDVFSLGITFLFLCLLRAPMELLNIAEMERELTKLIHSMSTRYTWRLIKYICKMIQIREEDRPDFMQLRAEMELDHDAFPTFVKKRTQQEVLQEQMGKFYLLREAEQRSVLNAMTCFAENIRTHITACCQNCGQPSQGSVLYCLLHWACENCANQSCVQCCNVVCPTHNEQLQE